MSLWTLWVFSPQDGRAVDTMQVVAGTYVSAVDKALWWMHRHLLEYCDWTVNLTARNVDPRDYPTAVVR